MGVVVADSEEVRGRAAYLAPPAFSALSLPPHLQALMLVRRDAAHHCPCLEEIGRVRPCWFRALIFLFTVFALSALSTLLLFIAKPVRWRQPVSALWQPRGIKSFEKWVNRFYFSRLRATWKGRLQTHFSVSWKSTQFSDPGGVARPSQRIRKHLKPLLIVLCSLYSSKIKPKISFIFSTSPYTWFIQFTLVFVG